MRAINILITTGASTTKWPARSLPFNPDNYYRLRIYSLELVQALFTLVAFKCRAWNRAKCREEIPFGLTIAHRRRRFRPIRFSFNENPYVFVLNVVEAIQPDFRCQARPAAARNCKLSRFPYPQVSIRRAR